jgi:hypothetical protein
VLAVVSAEASDLDRYPAARYAASLATFARHHELLLVYGEPRRPDDGPAAPDLLALLQAARPRQRVIGVLLLNVLAPETDCGTEVVRELLDDGSLPVAVTAAGDAAICAAALYTTLDADMLFRLTPAGILRSSRALTALPAPHARLEVA